MAIKSIHKILFWIVTTVVLVLGLAQSLPTAPRQASSTLLINEFVASNGSGLTDEDGDYSDWIEIYNPGRLAVNLSGWTLTDDASQAEKWSFPNITLGSGQYLIVFASGKDRKSTDPASSLHTNFKLNKGGEFLGLYNVLDAEFKDEISPRFPQQLRNVAYGRSETQVSYSFLTPPSPGSPNDKALAAEAVVADVAFSATRGFYDSPFQVELSTATPGAVIRYTIDGSEPTQTNGLDYTEPILIDGTTLLRAMAFKPKFLPSAVNTHSYIFLAEVITQPANPSDWPATWGMYRDFYPGLPTKGAPVMADYEMDPRIVNDPRFRDKIKEGLKAIPSISIVTAAENYDIYIHSLERGEAWERPVSVEFFDPHDDHRAFQINAGLRIQGVTGRWEYMPKKSFRLFFKGQYGATKLKYPLFPDSPVDEFDTLILRGGVNRSYAGYIDAVDYTQVTYTRDEWVRASQIAMSGVGSHGLFVHLYLNGLYWGLYNVVERPDHSFTSAYLGGDKEDWLAIKNGATVLNPDEVAQGAEMQIKFGEVVNGSDERYEKMLELLEKGDLTDPDKYAMMQTYVDTAQFSDYIILNLYAGNNDWGDNNWYIGMKNPSGQLKYFVWDAEQVWDVGARLYFGKPTPHHKMKPLFLGLMANLDFRLEFADRMYKHLFNDGALTDENSQARWLSINEPIERAIVGESARWGDTRYSDPIDPDDWVRARDAVLAQMEGNGDKLIALAREAGYYPDIDPPAFNQPGGKVKAGFELTMTLPARREAAEGSKIYYTTDGSDPRLPVTGAVATSARLYTSPLVLTTTTHVKTRALADDASTQPSSGVSAQARSINSGQANSTNSGQARSTNSGQVWSALNEATFRIVEGNGQLQITEIMYNPIGGNDYEFIELKNTGDVDLDLSNMSFDGIAFTFPPNTDPLAPGEFVVLASNPAAFADRYPNVTLDGTYSGQLSNAGESIQLKDPLGNIMASVEYDDEQGWPVSADGRGDSLVLVNLTADPHLPKSWRASSQLNGSPGTDEPTGP